MLEQFDIFSLSDCHSVAKASSSSAGVICHTALQHQAQRGFLNQGNLRGAETHQELAAHAAVADGTWAGPEVMAGKPPNTYKRSP